MNYLRNISLILLLSACIIYPQQLRLEGRIINREDGTALSYATIRVQNTGIGTTANSEGRYRLSLVKGSYRLVASFMGFNSDTLDITLKEKAHNSADFFLDPVSIRLPDVTVLPGKNPALEIIRQAIKYKKTREDKLLSYEFDAFTKGVLRAAGGVKAQDKSVTIGVGKKPDTSRMVIGGILENLSKGYFVKPDKRKDVIIARRQSSNLPPTVNLFTGNSIARNFYHDEILFIDRPLLSPIADKASDYYYYYIADTLASDKRNVFKIFFSTDKESDPGFEGYLYISDSTFQLLRVDASLNKAANFGGMIEKAQIYQQFLEYGDGIYMPVDFRLMVKFNFLGLARLGFEMNTVMENYKINSPVDPEIFNKAVLSVLPGADKKDSAFWKGVITIPNTAEEIKAYRKIDSIEAAPKSLWSRLLLQATEGKVYITDEFSILSPLSLYRFNRVEGHALSAGVYGKGLFNKRLDAGFRTDYGFADKKMKGDFTASVYMGNYRTYSLWLNGFNRLNVIFPESEAYSDFSATLLSLISKYEFRDYYYSRGVGFRIGGELSPLISLSAGFLNRTDNSAMNNSDFSIFARKKTYRLNPPVYETKVNQISLGFNLDWRDFIEDGYFRQRIAMGSSYVTLGGEVNLSRKELISSGIDFTIYNLKVEGTLNTFRSAKLNFRGSSFYSYGKVPYQLLFALPGNIDIVAKNYSFRTLRVGEVYGDRVGVVFLEHDWSDEFFRLLDLPVIKKMQLQLTTYFNAAWSTISLPSASILPVNKGLELKRPLFETGFSLGHILFPFRLEFTWRLSHRDENAFVFGLNTFVF